MGMERYTLFTGQTFTTTAPLATTWVTPEIPLENAAIWLYGHVRCKSGGTLSTSGTFSAVTAIVKYRDGWGTLTMSSGRSHQMSFDTAEIVGTTLGNGGLFSLLPSTDAFGIFASDSPPLPIFSVKFAFTKPAGVAETMQFDCDAFVQYQAVPDLIGTTAPARLLTGVAVS